MIKARAILGAVREYRYQNSELWVDCGDPHMLVTFLKPELVRVRIVPGGDFVPRFSWDVAKPDEDFPVVPLELQQTQHALFLLCQWMHPCGEQAAQFQEIALGFRKRRALVSDRVMQNLYAAIQCVGTFLVHRVPLRLKPYPDDKPGSRAD